MSAKTTLQQLMGGTSDIKEAFTFPGMGDIYSKTIGNKDEAGAKIFFDEVRVEYVLN